VLSRTKRAKPDCCRSSFAVRSRLTGGMRGAVCTHIGFTQQNRRPCRYRFPSFTSFAAALRVIFGVARVSRPASVRATSRASTSPVVVSHHVTEKAPCGALLRVNDPSGCSSSWRPSRS
jgi:hypothetical protein